MIIPAMAATAEVREYRQFGGERAPSEWLDMLSAAHATSRQMVFVSHTLTLELEAIPADFDEDRSIAMLARMHDAFVASLPRDIVDIEAP
jgi:hypothetical protein